MRHGAQRLSEMSIIFQATTTAQHTLRLDTFDGEAYEGALLYVTLSVNKFAYQSIEEVDPVDWWTLVGSIGGIWGKQLPPVTASRTLTRCLGSLVIVGRLGCSA